MGKFAMILGLFHNGKICNGSQLCFTMGKFAMGSGSVSQLENLQCSSWLCFTMGKFTMLLALFHNEKMIRIKH
jgi:hypothetical protein